MRSITPRTRILFGLAGMPRAERCASRSTCAHAGGRPAWRGGVLSVAELLAGAAIQSRAKLLDCARADDDDSLIVGSDAEAGQLDQPGDALTGQEPPARTDPQARAMRACALALTPRLIAIPRKAGPAQA